MRPRDLDALAGTVHDILIIGGGIYGLAIAVEAARRRLRVALVDAGDFAAATSFNHQKTAHGGLRSLQSGRLDRARESIRERRALARMAPRLLRPLPFIVATYRSVVKNRLVLRAGFRIDRWLGRHRNDAVEPELHLPPPRLTSRAATLKLFPGVRPEGLTGGAMWYDYQIVESNRLAIAFAESADAHGARLANYAEATAPLKESGAISGMRVRDRLSGTEFDVRARMTINAAGAHAGEIMRAFGVSQESFSLKAMNLVTSRPASDIALAAPARSGRMLTLVPWRGRALIGTSQSTDFKKPGDLPVTSAEVEAFIAEINVAFPALKLTRDDVLLVHRGIVPAERGRGGRAELLSAPRILDHQRDGVPGAMSVVGVKYTTARGVAARVVARAARRLGASVRALPSDREPLSGAGISDHEALAIETARAVGLELAPPIIRRLTAIYGDRCAPIVRIMAERSDWRMPLVSGQTATGAEVIYVIRHEMACTLADIVIRRTELGAGGHPGAALVESAARIAGDELEWDADRRTREIAAVDDFYRWR
jgi:glycerol-3-phosphate dehydrogenase